MATKPKTIVPGVPAYNQPLSPIQRAVTGQSNAPQGPPAPPQSGDGGGAFTPSQPIATLDYKTFLDGRTSTAAMAKQFAKLKGNTALLNRLNGVGKPKPTTTTPDPTTAAPSVATDPTTIDTTNPAVPDLSGAVNQIGAAPQIDTNTGLPVPTKFPTYDVNAAFSSAQRSLDQRNAALAASRAKAQSDNEAFATYINNLTQQSAQGLGTTLSQLGDQANTARTASMGNINDIVSQALQSAGPGAQNADLARMSGTAAQAAGDAALQAGQNAQNALPSEQAQAYLQRSGVDQGNIDKASDRLMQLEAGRQYNTALGSLGQEQSQLAQTKAAAQLQDTQNQRQYISDAANRQLMANEFNATMASKTQGYSTDLLKSWMTATAKMTAAQINKFVDKQIAQGKMEQSDKNNVRSMLTSAQNNIRTNRTSALNAATRAGGTANNMPAKAGSILNTFDSNRALSKGNYDNVSTQEKGLWATTAAKQLAASMPNLSWQTAGPLLASRYGDRMRDPNYVAAVQPLFTGTQ